MSFRDSYTRIKDLAPFRPERPTAFLVDNDPVDAFRLLQERAAAVPAKPDVPRVFAPQRRRLITEPQHGRRRQVRVRPRKERVLLRQELDAQLVRSQVLVHFGQPDLGRRSCSENRAWWFRLFEGNCFWRKGVEPTVGDVLTQRHHLRAWKSFPDREKQNENIHDDEKFIPNFL